MSDAEPLNAKTLDPILAGVIGENQERVTGWINGRPGCWGFLAGKAVASTRRHLGRPLDDGERRLVWNRLWHRLERTKAGPLV